MLRYHKAVYYLDTAEQALTVFTDSLNFKPWLYSSHCLDSLKHRTSDVQAILKYISGLTLNSSNIFEYSILDNNIKQACFRIKYNNVNDIIVIISVDKKIITIYLNKIIDKHETLNKRLYATI